MELRFYMKKEKEHLKVLISQFLIMYILSTFVLFFLFKFRYSYDYVFNNFILIFILAFISSFPATVNLWYSTQYKVLKIPKNSIKDIDRMNNFLSSNKIKTMHSLIPLKFSI